MKLITTTYRKFKNKSTSEKMCKVYKVISHAFYQLENITISQNMAKTKTFCLQSI